MIWKDIEGFSKYEISNKGHIRNKNTGRILATKKLSAGYPSLCLQGDDNKQYGKSVHRLLAEAFLIKENNKQQVNHKDGNKLNFSLENLEWVSCSDNHKHAYKTGLRKPSFLNKFGKEHNLSIPVLQFDRNFNFIKEYNNSREAERETGICQSNIISVCRDSRNHAGGFIWMYKEDLL